MIAPLDAATRRIVLDALRSAVAALEGDCAALRRGALTSLDNGDACANCAQKQCR